MQFILILKSNIYLHYTHGNILQDARFLFVFWFTNNNLFVKFPFFISRILLCALYDYYWMWHKINFHKYFAFYPVKEKQLYFLSFFVFFRLLFSEKGYYEIEKIRRNCSNTQLYGTMNTININKNTGKNIYKKITWKLFFQKQ